jgi:hypothetical protein
MKLTTAKAESPSLVLDDTPENLVALEAARYALGEDLVLAHSETEALPTFSRMTVLPYCST